MSELALDTDFGIPGLENPAVFFGAHANFARMGGLVWEIVASRLPFNLVGTDQHYDPDFVGNGFGFPVAATHLNARSSDPEIIAEKSKRYLKDSGCDGVFVYGDTASALGPAQAALELGLPIVHLEAGFRTHDATGKQIRSLLPEEDIRQRIDRIAHVLVPLIGSTHAALLAERDEGLPTGYITSPTGHPLVDFIDTPFGRSFDTTKPDPTLGILTIHRAANLQGGADSGLAQVLDQIADCTRDVQWLFPVYPGTRQLIDRVGLKIPENVTPVLPLDRVAMIELLTRAGIVVSDSAGLQVEATVAGRRLVIPRNETEYPELLGGTTVLASPDGVCEAVAQVRSAPGPSAERLHCIRQAFGGGRATQNMFSLLCQLTVSRETVRR